MDSYAKGFVGLVFGVLCLFVTVLITFFATSHYACDKSVTIEPSKNSEFEYLLRMHDPISRTTAIKAIGAQKCFILMNDNDFSDRPRSLQIIKESLSKPVLKALAGSDILDFCGDYQAVPVELADEKIEAEKSEDREKRQAGRTGGDAAQLRRTMDRLRVNECQNERIVDCGSAGSSSGGVYECNTGPGQVYKAQVRCKSATQFTLTLGHRCDECKATKGNRLLKCIQKFIIQGYGTDQDACAED